MTLKNIIAVTNDSTIVKIYEADRLITKGYWFQDNILNRLDTLVYTFSYNAIANVLTINHTSTNQEEVVRRFRNS
jgi:hypothetical protein